MDPPDVRRSPVLFSRHRAPTCTGFLAPPPSLRVARASPQFMQPRYDSVCDTVFKYKDHRDALVRRTVMALLPLLATFDTATFTKSFMEPCMAYLLSQLRKEKERSAGTYTPPRARARACPGQALPVPLTTKDAGQGGARCTAQPLSRWASWPSRCGRRSCRR